MAATIPSTALVPVQPVFAESEQLALAGFLAGYRGLTRKAYTLGWDAVVIGEYERAFYGSQYAVVGPLLQHYGSSCGRRGRAGRSTSRPSTTSGR